ncbi:hypothetical protein AX14_009368 [Amanita brunnescens Koide BX004]|nr:hypothetical protein AX14_009368 [Amanita brunnescens Koide BX004]
MDSVAVQPADPITKPASPPPRPPRSPTRPPPCVPKPPPARKAAQPKQSYAKAAASVPAAPVAAPAHLKAPASPPSKTAALRKSCIKQGMKATKVIVRFPPSTKQPSVHQLWGTLMAFKPTDIGITLRGDFILTFSQVLDSSDHSMLVKKFKKVYSVDVKVLNQGTTSLLKFPLVPTHHPDSSAVTSEWLHKTIAGHPKWQDVEFVQAPCFIVPAGKTIGYTTTVFTEVADDRGASVAKRLLQTDVLFHTVPQHCKPWSVSVAVKHPPGVLPALETTSPQPTLLPQRRSQGTIQSNAPIVMANTGPPPAHVPSTRHGSTSRNLLHSRSTVSKGYEKPAAITLASTNSAIQ